MSCAHKTIRDHSTAARDPQERRVWTCSHCKTRAPWDDTWGYYGNHECLTCQTAQIDFVWCSEACRKALAEKHKLAPEKPIARAKRQASAPKKRVPAWQREAEAAGWKPPEKGGS